MKTLTLIPLFLLMFTYAGYSQDAEGCKDHPMFNRMPDYFIAECSLNFDQAEIMMADGNEVPVKGNITYLYYAPKENNKQPPSFDQIVRFYENAIKKHSGKKIFYNPDRATLKMKSENLNLWISVTNLKSSNGQGYYELTIAEVEEMK
jgi:OmpA-OmpF porin, OOP family